MEIKYRFKRDVVSRAAAQLSWQLSQLHSSIHLLGNDRVVNGKSLVGVLSAQYKMGDEVTITYDDNDELAKIKEIFNEIGGEI
jgi:phosphotransferase system HPr (HPr) family protein